MENCAECLSSTECNKCVSGFFLDENKTCVQNCIEPFWGSTGACVEKCQASEFQSVETDRLCLKCRYTCKTCDKVSTNCTSCNYPYFLNPNTNVCEKKCSDDLWGNINERTCDKSCKSNEYQEKADQTCRPCDSNCNTCSDSPKTCTSCSVSSETFLNKIDKICVKNCPLNFWRDYTLRECLEGGCDPLIIIDEALKTCKSKCEVDEYLAVEANLFVCKKCSLSIQNCFTCANATTCTSCSNNLFLLKEKDSSRVNCTICNFLQRGVGSPGTGRDIYIICYFS